MKTIKGPAIFLAQFAGNGAHLQNFHDMCKWAKECGYVGVQLPSWDARVMDLAKAASSKTSRSPTPRKCEARGNRA